MATNKDITMRQFNGADYDILYPKTIVSQVDGAVGYDTAQSLTPAQQAQARSNINAAPGGYGLGETVGLTISSLDEIKGYGFFRLPTNIGITPDDNSNWGGVFIGPNINYGTLLVSRIGGIVAQKTKAGNEWTPWEWVNPPMEVEVEYRTTERYLGKPVYAKRINCGKPVAASTTKTVNISGLNVRWPLDCKLYQGAERDEYLVTPPSNYVSSLLVTNNTIQITSSATPISIYDIYAVIKYTKYTD